MSAEAPLRVVLACPQAHYAGHYWRVTHTLAGALAEAGAEVSAIVATTPTGGGEIPGRTLHSLPPLWHHLTRSHVLDGGRTWRSTLLNNIETLACAWRALPEAMSASGGIIHFLSGTHIFIFLLALCSRRPVFLSIYGDFISNRPGSPTLKERFRNWLLDHLLRQHKLVIIVDAESLRDRWRGLLGEDIHTIPYAIAPPPARETKVEARAALGLPQGVPILLLFGTQREGKDYGVVLRAARLLNAAVHLLFVGKTISQNNPQRLAAELGFQQATFIDRFVDETEVPRFFFAADAVVLPYEEGFDRGSGVILDACAYGRPIIASRTGFLQRFVETHQVGFLYGSGDEIDLVRAIRQLLALDAAEQASLEARVTGTADAHSWPQIVQTYLRLYRQYAALHDREIRASP